MAAADLLGKTAGDTVKRVSKDDAERGYWAFCRVEGWMEVIAWDEDVKERA